MHLKSQVKSWKIKIWPQILPLTAKGYSNVSQTGNVNETTRRPGERWVAAVTPARRCWCDLSWRSGYRFWLSCCILWVRFHPQILKFVFRHRGGANIGFTMSTRKLHVELRSEVRFSSSHTTSKCITENCQIGENIAISASISIRLVRTFEQPL